MSDSIDPYTHLEDRCNHLIQKYIDPIIQAEEQAIRNSSPLPTIDFDSLAAFRLLSHAELEGYFERKAGLALAALDQNFKEKKPLNSKFAALIMLYLIKKQVVPKWSAPQAGSDDAIRTAERADFTNLSSAALGYGRQFIQANNGIKENSIYILSSLMGFFNDELDSVLVAELNQYGKKRGDVAHDSWARKTNIFDSADLEKKRLISILDLTKKFYEQVNIPNLVIRKPCLIERVKFWFRRNKD